MEECLFCKITIGNIPAERVYEDERFIAFLDIKPINLGHTLIVSKVHHRNLFDMPEDEVRALGPVIQKIARAVQKATSADGINIGWNNEGAAGQLIFHSHVHVIPRISKDGLKHWPGKENITPEELQKTAERIRSAVQS